MNTTTKSRAKLPENVARDMKMFHMGLGGVPESYIRFHETLARASLESLVERFQFRVLKESMNRDGWMDGMRTLVVTVENSHGMRMTMRWHDGNQDWMKKMSVGGWALLAEVGLRDFASKGQENPDEGPCTVVNVLTGEKTKVPKGWAWDNYMEFLHS